MKAAHDQRNRAAADVVPAAAVIIGYATLTHIDDSKNCSTVLHICMLLSHLFLPRENYTTMCIKPMINTPVKQYAHTGSSEIRTPMKRNLHAGFDVYSASLQLAVCCRRIHGNKDSLHPVGCLISRAFNGDYYTFYHNYFIFSKI